MLAKILVPFAFLIIGTLLGVFLCSYSFFEFDSKINYFDLFTFCLTTIVGLWLAININKSFTRNNSEKQLLITELKTIVEFTDKLSVYIDNGKLPMSRAAGHFKLINKGLLFFDELLYKSHCGSLSAKKCRSHVIELRRIVTSESDTRGYYTFRNSKLLLAKNEIGLLRSGLYDLIFSINKI